VSFRGDAGVGDENAESCGVFCPFRISAQCAARTLFSEKLMCFCASGTDGSFDLRRRAFALNGWVSTSSATWIPSWMGRLSAGVGRRHPVTIRKASLMAGSKGRYEHCGTRKERSTLRLNAPRLGWLFAKLLLQHRNRTYQGLGTEGQVS